MAEMKKIATRVSYGNTLVELARQGADDLVVFDADLAAATKTEIFRKEYPDRHFDCRAEHGRRRRRYVHDGLCAVRVQLCDVCRRPRV